MYIIKKYLTIYSFIRKDSALKTKCKHKGRHSKKTKPRYLNDNKVL